MILIFVADFAIEVPSEPGEFFAALFLSESEFISIEWTDTPAPAVSLSCPPSTDPTVANTHWSGDKLAERGVARNNAKTLRAASSYVVIEAVLLSDY